jgi:hypothetical protein
MPCAQVGVRLTRDGAVVYAPAGFDDIAGMVVRPNRTANFQAASYNSKVRRWREIWPEIAVIPA